MKRNDDSAARLERTIKEESTSDRAVDLFRKLIYAYYRKHKRILPWRSTSNPYRIVVSEIMLQQTQVERVLDKYKLFIKSFPNFSALATAPLAEVMKVWQGLGYNRRAISLKKIAGSVVKDYKGRLPVDEGELIKLPGIGKYTAAAICAFVSNTPSLFIETNIRRVFIHFFFHNKNNVKDEEIFPLLEKTLDRKNPKEFYYALMDYGAKLKKDVENPNRRSAHYSRQSPFKGSRRQVRGRILNELLQHRALSKKDLTKNLKVTPDTLGQILSELVKEGFLKKQGNKFIIS